MAKGRQRHKDRGGEAGKPTQASAAGGSARMQQAWKLYEAGDKLSARREAKAILESQPSEEDAKQAADLLERSKLPPVALYTAAGAAVLIVLLIILAIARAP